MQRMKSVLGQATNKAINYIPSKGTPMEMLAKHWSRWNGLQPHKKNNIVQPDPKSFQGQNHHPKSTHGVNHCSRCICNTGWSCWASMRGEALGPMKAQCPSVGECQGQEAGVGGLVRGGRVQREMRKKKKRITNMILSNKSLLSQEIQ